MEEAILARDFETFARVTRRESNSFHATCLDTDPPIFYLNETSRWAIRAVEMVNERVGRTVATYTFDAGPNCVVYYLEREWGVVEEMLGSCFVGKEGWKGGGGMGLRECSERVEEGLREGVSRVIMTGVGEGPVSVEEHLIDERGEPLGG